MSVTNIVPWLRHNSKLVQESLYSVGGYSSASDPVLYPDKIENSSSFNLFCHSKIPVSNMLGISSFNVLAVGGNYDPPQRVVSTAMVLKTNRELHRDLW